MLSTRLDYLFPFIVFSYGILVVFVLESSHLKKIGQEKLQAAYQQLAAQKPLAWICFWVGGFWSLQNLLFS
jgi:hypothetical protein